MPIYTKSDIDTYLAQETKIGRAGLNLLGPHMEDIYSLAQQGKFYDLAEVEQYPSRASFFQTRQTMADVNLQSMMGNLGWAYNTWKNMGGTGLISDEFIMRNMALGTVQGLTQEDINYIKEGIKTAYGQKYLGATAPTTAAAPASTDYMTYFQQQKALGKTPEQISQAWAQQQTPAAAAAAPVTGTEAALTTPGATQAPTITQPFFQIAGDPTVYDAKTQSAFKDEAALIAAGGIKNPAGSTDYWGNVQRITPDQAKTMGLAPTGSGYTSSITAPAVTTPATTLPVVQTAEDYYKQYLDAIQQEQTTQQTLLEQAHQQTITQIQTETGHNRDLLQVAYDTANRDIQKAWQTLGISDILPRSKVDELSQQSADLTKTFTINLTKLNADEQNAIAKGDTAYASQLSATRTDYLNSVQTVIQNIINLQEKNMNYARERVSTLVSSGGIATLTDAQLTQTAAESGYSLADLQAMRDSVAARDDLKTQTALANIEYKTVSEQLAAERLALQAETTALAQAKVYGGADAEKELKTYVDPSTGFMDISAYRDTRAKYANLGLPSGTFDTYFSSYLSPEDRSKFGIGKVTAAALGTTGALTSTQLTKLATYGISPELANAIHERYALGYAVEEIISDLTAGGYTNAQELLNAYNQFMQMGYTVTPTGG